MSEMLTDVVGRGSIERAYGAMLDALVRHGADTESDIRAYFDPAGSRRQATRSMRVSRSTQRNITSNSAPGFGGATAVPRS